MEAFLESLFLKILNMSLTASYVIAAILIVRLLLKKAPGKYSYALWAAAAFRLLCPVSFESFFSLFALKGLSLNIEKSSAGAAEIVHIPQNIGLMPQPEITSGIPAVNNVVNPMLPAATPHVSVNPMQIWIFIGMLLWLAGMALLILLSLISLLRLKSRLSTSTRLEGNVWQSESVRSPFILGLFRPRIYIPYGLGEKQLGYVLEHERGHIRRGDHITKLLAFAILCLHWFNPLVWLSYHLMGRDMEKSCDERVLSRDPNIGPDYSETLLSFAVNRRLPLPTALAFGESGVKSRIKNALRWKKPRLWVSITALLACIAAVCAFAANPKDEPSGHELRDAEPMALAGTYVPWDCVHQHPAVSYVSRGGNNGYKYVFEDGKLTVMDQALGKPAAEFELAEAWQELPWSDEEWEAMLMLPTDSHMPLSRQYMSILYCPLDGDDQFLMLVDGQLWVVSSYTESNGSRYINLIYSLVPQEDMGYAQGHFMPTYSSQWGIPINFDIENLEHVNILCATGMVAFAGESGMEIKDFDRGDDNSMLAGDTLLWNPINVSYDTAMVYPVGVIQFTAVTDTQGISGTIYLENGHMGDGSGGYYYTVRVVGTGLYIEQDRAGRISITHSGEGAWSLNGGGEVSANSPWNWTSSVSVADIKGFSTNLKVEFGGSFDLESSLTDILNSLPPEAFSTGRGYPGENFVTIKTEDGSSFTLRRGPDFIELSIEGPAAELYDSDNGVWEIRSDALLYWFDCAMPMRVEESDTETLLELLASLEPDSHASYMVGGLALSPEFDPDLSAQMMVDVLKTLEQDDLSAATLREAVLDISLGYDGFSLSLFYDMESTQLVFQGHWGELHCMPGLVWDVDSPELEEYLADFVRQYAVYTGANQSGE